MLKNCQSMIDSFSLPIQSLLLIANIYKDKLILKITPYSIITLQNMNKLHWKNIF